MTNSPYRNSFIIAATAATLSLGAVGCNETDDQSSMQNQGMTDSAITTGVEGQLAQERNLDSSDISVATADGTVTLDGSVTDAEARSAAESAARSFDGVNNVDNRLSVQSTGVGESIKNTGDAAAQATSDTWITTKVKSVLLADSEAQGMDIEVNTKDGVVTLEGELNNQTDIDYVKALIIDVEGVKRVNTNALTVASR